MYLQEASFEMTHAAFSQKSDDEKLLVQFSLEPHPDSVASEQEGRPIFRETEYILIVVPGDKDSVVHRPVMEMDKRRFPRQYQAFKNNQSQDAVVGTPLRNMTWLTPALVKELEYFNCKTVEQLANMPDSHTIKFMALNKLKQLAKDYLQAAKETAPLTSMRAELDTKSNELIAAQQQIQELAKRLEALEKKK